MDWRGAIVIVALSLAIVPAASTQSVDGPKPSITAHQLVADNIKLAYKATAGLTPISDADGAQVGDMSYIAYTVAPKRGAKPRPVAFIWNGGPGSNSIPLHYGAFGPLRVVDGALTQNAGSLLNVADLVFIDQMETGFGRILEGNPVFRPEQDAAQFVQVIEAWLTYNSARDRPIILIGESYGVYRTVLVAERLLAKGIRPTALVLISGYELIGVKLDKTLRGALRVPGYAALAFERGALDPTAGSDALKVHDAALRWVLPIFRKATATADYMAGWEEFAKGLGRFTGLREQDILDNRLPIGSSGAPHAFNTLDKLHVKALFPEMPQGYAYDVRPSAGFSDRVWISRSVVEHIRRSLVFDLDRDYLGLEFDTRVLRWRQGSHDAASPASRPESAVRALRRGPFEPPADGLAESTVNMSAAGGFGRVDLGVKSLLSPILDAAPDIRVFLAGGVFDDVFPCAVGAEMARRDLAPFGRRVASRCYAGGHMMYFEKQVGEKLSADLREFIRRGQ